MIQKLRKPRNPFARDLEMLRGPRDEAKAEKVKGRRAKEKRRLQRELQHGNDDYLW
jgi:hypothetical protein